MRSRPIASDDLRGLPGLAGALIDAASTARVSGMTRRLLDRAHGRLDQVLAAEQLPRRARAQ